LFAVDPLEIDGSAFEPPAPLIRLFYQVEIRRHQLRSQKSLTPLTAADARLYDDIMAIAGLAGAKIADLPAIFGWADERVCDGAG
jgi:hypothetical protein